MAEPKVYNLYLQPGMKLVLVLVVVGFVGMAAAFIVISTLAPSPKAPPLPVGIALLVVAVVYLVWILSLPYRITLAEDGTVEFIGLLKRRTVRTEEIRSIKSQGFQFGFFIVQTDRGKIRILAQFDGFHDFLTRLEALHPGVELRGC